VRVAVAVGVRVAVLVGVRVAVAVGVRVGVRLGVGVAPQPGRIVKEPPGPVPELVKGTKGGLSASTKAGPGTAPLGSTKVNCVESMIVSGILGFPSVLSPPRFTAMAPWRLNRLIAVRVEKPSPSTVMTQAFWVTLLTAMRAAIIAASELLWRAKDPALPALLTLNVPGPGAGAMGPETGMAKLNKLEFKPGSPGKRKNGPTFPPGHAQKISAATPLIVSKPIPLTSTFFPGVTTVFTTSIAKLGSRLMASIGTAFIPVIVGMPEAGSP
jgi:hypothetical protein